MHERTRNTPRNGLANAWWNLNRVGRKMPAENPWYKRTGPCNGTHKRQHGETHKTETQMVV